MHRSHMRIDVHTKGSCTNIFQATHVLEPKFEIWTGSGTGRNGVLTRINCYGILAKISQPILHSIRMIIDVVSI
jgi:hypothetical protein